MSLPSETTRAAATAPPERTPDDVRQRGRGLAVARGVWLGVAALVTVIFLFGVPLRFTQLQTPCAGTACADLQLTPAGLRELAARGLAPSAYAAYLVALDVLSAAVWCAVATLIFWRKADDRMALFSALTLLTFGGVRFPDVPAALPAAYPGWWLPVTTLRFLGSACLSLFVYVFPNGRFVPWWTRWVAGAWIAVQVPEFFLPGSPLDPLQWPPLIKLAGFLGFVASVTLAQVYRYRQVSTPAQRRQTRWAIFGIVAALSGFLGLAFVLPVVVLPALTPLGVLTGAAVYTGTVVSLLLIPLCIGIAILRARLWDIDLIINRALVYGGLTAVLALVYLVGVAGLGLLVHALSGQSSPVSIVVSTLAIAGLFHPLRQRMQATIDRSFYRRTYDAARTLESFSATLRSEVDLAQLSEHLLAAVRETMQPAHVSLWLRQPERREEDQIVRGSTISRAS